MLTRLRQRRHDEAGFTLIELLVVILIIGILAAIAIPNFLGQTKKAQDASAKSDARNAVAAMESCFTDAQSYLTCDNSTLTAGGLTVTTGTAKGTVKANAAGGAGTATGYAVTAYSKSSSNTSFTITNTAGVMTYSCTPVAANTGCTASNWAS